MIVIMKKRRARNRDESACTIPPVMPTNALPGITLPNIEHEYRAICQYVERETSDEIVVHGEKIKTERVYDVDYDVWDVHTDKNRWWVITSPTNLYLQQTFPSLDYVLSFHIGVTTRVQSRQQIAERPPFSDRFFGLFERLAQVVICFDTADEAEDYQGIGVRLRECLLDLANGFRQAIPSPTEPPKNGDFVHWADLAANHFAAGSSNDDLRSTLKALSKSAWQLACGLTHAKQATRLDGMICHLVIDNVITLWTFAIARFERGGPNRCPKCKSYRLFADFRCDDPDHTGYVTLCERCGWEATESRSTHAVKSKKTRRISSHKG